MKTLLGRKPHAPTHVDSDLGSRKTAHVHRTLQPRHYMYTPTGNAVEAHRTEHTDRYRCHTR